MSGSSRVSTSMVTRTFMDFHGFSWMFMVSMVAASSVTSMCLVSRICVVSMVATVSSSMVAIVAVESGSTEGTLAKPSVDPL